MLLFKVKRKWLTDDSSIGELFVDNKVERFCYTLEDKQRDNGIKIPKVTAIPCGRYRMILDYSNRFKRTMLHILNVPQFDGIRIHGGNTAENTEGCIIVGKFRAADKVWDCKDVLAAIEKLVTIAIANKEEVWIEISDDEVENDLRTYVN
jgi:hypothetical protein